MRPLTILIALVAATPALAVDHGVDVNLGGLNNGDPMYEGLTGDRGMFTYGASGIVRLHEYVGVVGSYNHTRRGGGDAPRTAYFSDQFGLGVKGDYAIKEWLRPTLSAQFLLYRGVAKLDADASSRTNPGQVRVSGLAPGGQFLGGVELRIPQADRPLTVAFTAEAGYTIVAKHTYSDPKVVGLEDSVTLEGVDVGDMAVSGFTFRGGIGLRF